MRHFNYFIGISLSNNIAPPRKLHRERQCISHAGTVRPINIYLVSTFFYAHLGVSPLPFNGGAFVTVPRCFVHSYMTRKYTVYVLRSGGASTPLNNKPCLFFFRFCCLAPPPLHHAVPHFLRRHRHSLLSIIRYVRKRRGSFCLASRKISEKKKRLWGHRALRPYCELTYTVNSLGRYGEPRRLSASFHHTLNSLDHSRST